jgi:hypothetical protein
MRLLSASAAALGALLLAGCGSSDPVKADVVRGIDAIQSEESDEQLRDDLRRTIRRLRADRPRSAADRKAKPIALRGFAACVRGADSRIAFEQNDSGNVEAATRDAKRAYRSFGECASSLIKLAGVYRLRP